MIGRLRVGIVLRDHRLAVVAVAGARVSQVFTLEAQENPAVVLRAELEARRLKVRRVRLALQRSLVTVKVLDLPPTVGGSLAQIVGFELERHLPFPAEDATFDFLPLPLAKGASQQVLLVACERRTVDRALRLLEEASLTPRSLTVACHDLVALVGRWSRENRAVWAHVVGDEAELLFLEGPRLRLSRSVPGDDEAALATEIGRSLSHLGWEECEGLWVSGDGAQRLLASRDLSELGVPVTPPPWLRRARGAVASLGESANGLTLLALGAALGRRRSLDLLPEALRPRQLSWGQVVTSGSFAAAAILGIGVLFAQGYQGQRYLNRLDQAIRALDPDVRSVERLLAELEGKRRLLSTLQTVQESALRPLPFLLELTELIPTDAWLTALALDTKGVEITGQAAAANQLIPLLEGSPRLEKVEFASPVTKGRDKEQFRIKASWEAVSKSPVPPPPRTPPARRPRGVRSP